MAEIKNYYSGKFYKYVKAETAINHILPDSTLQFSHASLFNDPFDLIPDSLTSFDLEHKWDEFNHEYKEAIRRGDDLYLIRTGQEKSMSISQQAFLKIYLEPDAKELGISNEDIANDIEADKDLFMNLIKELHQSLLNYFNQSKVFCATSNYDNLLMWSHYSENHTGLVLEFDASVEDDSVFQLLKPVQYKTTRPALWNSPSELISSSFKKITPKLVKEFTQECLYTKSPEWQYEQELRIIDLSTPITSNVFYSEFTTSELTGVFYGSRINEADFSSIETILDSKYPHVKKHQMYKDTYKYQLKSKNLD